MTLLRGLLEAVALQLGNELSRLVGFRRETVERILQLLERSLIAFRLRALSRNSRKAIARGRKVYFYDLGIRNALIKNFNDLHLRSDMGALWENVCINERLNHNQYHGRMVNVWFWRTCDQEELDLIEESGGRLAGYEFKWGGGSARGARAFLESYPGSTIDVIEPGNDWDFAGVNGTVA